MNFGDTLVVLNRVPSQLPAGEPSIGGPVPGDVNGDGVVNFGDALAVLSHVPSPLSSNPQADVNGDGAINFGDALAVLDALTASLLIGEADETNAASSQAGKIPTVTGINTDPGRATPTEAEPLVVLVSPPLEAKGARVEINTDISAPTEPTARHGQTLEPLLVEFALAQFQISPMRNPEEDEDDLAALLEPNLDSDLLADLH